jgi:hypothetical protein
VNPTKKRTVWICPRCDSDMWWIEPTLRHIAAHDECGPVCVAVYKAIDVDGSKIVSLGVREPPTADLSLDQAVELATAILDAVASHRADDEPGRHAPG